MENPPYCQVGQRQLFNHGLKSDGHWRVRNLPRKNRSATHQTGGSAQLTAVTECFSLSPPVYSTTTAQRQRESEKETPFFWKWWCSKMVFPEKHGKHLVYFLDFAPFSRGFSRPLFDPFCDLNSFISGLVIHDYWYLKLRFHVFNGYSGLAIPLVIILYCIIIYHII